MKPSLETLKDMAAYAEAYPPREPFAPRGDAKVVYMHPHERWRVQREVTSDLGYGLYRDDLLAEAGEASFELDAKAFAEGVYQAIGDQLSLRMLETLAAVFTEKAQQERALHTERCRALGREPA